MKEKLCTHFNFFFYFHRKNLSFGTFHCFVNVHFFLPFPILFVDDAHKLIESIKCMFFSVLRSFSLFYHQYRMSFSIGPNDWLYKALMPCLDFENAKQNQTERFYPLNVFMYMLDGYNPKAKHFFSCCCRVYFVARKKRTIFPHRYKCLESLCAFREKKYGFDRWV